MLLGSACSSAPACCWHQEFRATTVASQLWDSLTPGILWLLVAEVAESVASLSVGIVSAVGIHLTVAALLRIGATELTLVIVIL